MRVLVVDHTAHVSGAEHSMLTLLAGLPPEIHPELACPFGGDLERRARAAGIDPHRIPAGDGGLRLHPSGTPKAIAAIVSGAIQTARIARRERVDLIHANSVRAGLIGVGAAALTRLPLIVHVRDVLPRGRVADATLRIVAAGADRVVAISDYVARAFARAAPSDKLTTVFNPVELERFAVHTGDRDRIRATLGVGSDEVLMGVVGQISPWKGQRETVEVLARLSDTHPQVRLAVVGEVKFAESTTRYNNRAYAREIDELVAREHLDDRVLMLGEREDIPELMQACDIVLVPSWSEPFGRVVIEALAAGTAVIATTEGGPAEIITDGHDGVLLTPRDVESWAQTVAGLVDNPQRRSRLGAAGQARAADFGVGRHVGQVAELYRAAVAGRSA